MTGLDIEGMEKIKKICKRLEEANKELDSFKGSIYDYLRFIDRKPKGNTVQLNWYRPPTLEVWHNQTAIVMDHYTNYPECYWGPDLDKDWY